MNLSPGGLEGKYFRIYVKETDAGVGKVLGPVVLHVMADGMHVTEYFHAPEARELGEQLVKLANDLDLGKRP
jgi:hypothetical protein